MSNVTVQQENPVAKLKRVLNVDSVQQQFKNALKEGAGLFVASLIDLYGNDKYLQQCDPNAVIMEALKAATLKLPINKSLGFAYIVPYKDNKNKTHVPTFILGYKGYLQLAQRTGKYKYINADCVYEGERIEQDRMTGDIIISGDPISENTIGYFAFIETINGFRKPEFWPKEKIIDHAKKYSQSYHSDYSPWKKQFDIMAMKTVIRSLLSRYGIMSVDMANAIDSDSGDYKEPEIETAAKPKVSYEATALPPGEKVNVVDFKQHSKPPAEQTETKRPQKEVRLDLESQEQPDKKPDPPPQVQQGGECDEFGMPIEHPLAKDNWFNKRRGGLDQYLIDNKDLLTDMTAEGIDVLEAKCMKIYGKNIADIVKTINVESASGDVEKTEVEIHPGHPDLAKPPEQPTMSQQQVLESDAANQLYSLGKKYPAKYKQVVRNQIPTSIEQIFGWMDEINQLVIDDSKGGADNDNEGKW